MAKYKLTVKYSGVCELSIAGDIPDIIKSEFDQYVKSILYKKEEWENFETNFKEAARLEYGDPRKHEEPGKETVNKLPEETEEIKEKPVEQTEEAPKEEDITPENNKPQEEEPKAEKKVPPKKVKKTRLELISFGEYINGKKIKTPLDEFVVGACYLDEILNIKEFSLKQINAKLYPAFKRLASSIVIDEAIERVLIEIIKEDDKVRYKINQNAWNYHNFDLVVQK